MDPDLEQTVEKGVIELRVLGVKENDSGAKCAGKYRLEFHNVCKGPTRESTFGYGYGLNYSRGHHLLCNAPNFLGTYGIEKDFQYK